ncbi:MAG: hypothetical protein FJX54_17550 [Alphaproteobacteria bacterium]|nr:hypothetical protein [Alphaproteobacteria bacterium]
MTLLSPSGAAAYWGALYFQSLMRLAGEAEPEARFTAILDCADRPGDVLAAFRQGIKHVVFHGTGEVRDKLAAIAEAQGARLLARVPADLDLARMRDPVAACRDLFAVRL